MKILVGYDGSKIAEDAVAKAHKHALAFGAEVHIVTALEQSPSLTKNDIEKAENKLEKLQKPFKKDNVACEISTAVSYESPGESLVRFAKENDIEELIIGVRRRSKVGKLVFGSTAQYVILQAPCTVTTVK